MSESTSNNKSSVSSDSGNSDSETDIVSSLMGIIKKYKKDKKKLKKENAELKLEIERLNKKLEGLNIEKDATPNNRDVNNASIKNIQQVSSSTSPRPKQIPQQLYSKVNQDNITTKSPNHQPPQSPQQLQQNSISSTTLPTLQQQQMLQSVLAPNHKPPQGPQQGYLLQQNKPPTLQPQQLFQQDLSPNYQSPQSSQQCYQLQQNSGLTSIPTMRSLNYPNQPFETQENSNSNQQQYSLEANLERQNAQLNDTLARFFNQTPSRVSSPSICDPFNRISVPSPASFTTSISGRQYRKVDQFGGCICSGGCKTRKCACVASSKSCSGACQCSKSKCVN